MEHKMFTMIKSIVGSSICKGVNCSKNGYLNSEILNNIANECADEIIDKIIEG